AHPAFSTLFPYTTLFRSDPGFIFAVPEADAIVSAGSRVQKVTLPKMARLIGGEHLVDPYMDARGELTVPMRYLCCSVDTTANTRSEEHTSELQSRFDLVC